MTASELRHLAERLCAVEPHDYEDRAITEAAAEVLKLVAWAEDSKVYVERYGGMWFVHVLSNGVEYGDHFFIATLRRAKEASKS